MSHRTQSDPVPPEHVLHFSPLGLSMSLALIITRGECERPLPVGVYTGFFGGLENVLVLSHVVLELGRPRLFSVLVLLLLSPIYDH